MNRLGRVNRVLLGLVGLVLLALGVVGLLGLWPFSGRDDVLLSVDERQHWRAEGWWWPVVLAVLALCVLLALWWLLAQLRRSRLETVLVDTGDGAFALLRGRALEAALSAELAAQDGVARSQVTLHGRRQAPTARVRLLLAPYAVPADALDALADQALTHARDSAGLTELRAEARLHATDHHARRVT
ncbi:alkaline shock response membrane anchor protein AmaP [Streptomyces sp. NRRL S-87]|uniref:alkaline shock response membrane anchor protein AmaP n=1 Tax=Streptomyces sp. NRRL S-87 TaxID=1463920 RepID=UPI0004BF5B29|nr:alkaline shock response membrane anchor protein AmaP [Streptomyces sp. NRRL S-87]